MNSSILEVKNLNFSLENRKIIQNISLELAQNQIMAFLGQSGSGKSTLLKLIAGFLDPDAGDLKIEGERIVPPSEKLIPGHAKIKMVRQDNPLFPNVSLRENIEYELRFYNEEYKRKRVEKLLKLTRLTAVANHLPRHASEGEQQRAAIARALAEEPALLLLDEPFSNLDYANKSRLKEEIREIVQSEEMACIFVTHDISDVFGTANRLAILKQGKIVQEGGPIEIYRKPKSAYEAGLTGDYNLLKAEDAKKLFQIDTRKRKVLIRPEEIKFKEKGQFSGLIISSLNKGFYNELKLELSGQILTVYASHSETKEGRVQFDIESWHAC